MATRNTSLKGRTLSLLKLIKHQRGTIVSRTLVNKKTGTVTLFAFDKGQELSEHSAPYDATLQVLDGEACVRIAGKPHRLKAGDLIIMPANIPHAVEATGKFIMMLIMIRSE